MKKTAWSQLPNATHIDRVLASVKAHPDEWAAVWALAREAARSKAALDAAGAAALDAARRAAFNAAWDKSLALTKGWDAAWPVVSALVAWDHVENYLDMTPDLLRVWHELSEDPACILLLPYAHAQELIAAKEEVLA